MIVKNEEEVLLHDKLHRSMSRSLEPKDYFKKSRLRIIPYAERLLGKGVSGSVLDLGAGNGYAGIWLAINRGANVISLECTSEAVNKLIPNYAKQFGVSDLVKAEVGSFYDLSSHQEKFDFVICFGVLHHSKNLLSVMDNVYKALKPGAILIALEPFSKSVINNSVFREIYDSDEEFAGKVIRHGDRDDHFYRECEYLTAVHHSGLNIVCEEDVTKLVGQTTMFSSLRISVVKMFSKVKAKLNGNEKYTNESFAQMRSRRLNPRHLLLVCQKPDKENSPAPHRWSL